MSYPASGEVPADHVYILVVGSLNMDFILKVNAQAERGGHVQAVGYMEMPGGHGANQAVACRRLSRRAPKSRAVPPASSNSSPAFEFDVRVSIVGAVGDGTEDASGKAICDMLASEGVKTEVVEVPCKTGIAHIHVDAAGEPRITNCAGANFSLLPKDIPSFEPRPDVILVQLESPLETISHVLQKAREANIPVLLNAAPPSDKIDPKLYEVDYLVVNQLGVEKFIGWPRDPLRNQADYLEACKRYHKYKAKMVIITLGDQGVFASRAQDGRPPSTWFVPAEPVEPDHVQDTTGASDAFIGAYITEILRQQRDRELDNVEHALSVATKAGAYVVKRFGSMGSIPYRDEIDDGFSH